MSMAMHGLRRGPRVDGRNPAPVEVGSLSHDLQGFIHPRCRISSINSMFPKEKNCGSKRPMKKPYRTRFLFQASRSTGAGHADIECKLRVSTSAGHEVLLLFQVVVSKEFNIDSTNDMTCHCDGILGVAFDLPRCLFANYLYSCALLRPTVGVCETTMTLVQYPWARLARLSPTMANLGLSLSIPLSASVDAARAPQFFLEKGASPKDEA